MFMVSPCWSSCLEFRLQAAGTKPRTAPPKDGTPNEHSSSEKCRASFCIFMFARCPAGRLPKKYFQITTAAVIKLDAFALEHALLSVSRQHNAPSRNLPLRINYAVPRCVGFIRAVHNEANRARRVAFAKHVSDLPVSHYAPAGYAPNDLVNAFAILSGKLQLVLGFCHHIPR